jgi:hypothetical protein
MKLAKTLDRYRQGCGFTNKKRVYKQPKKTKHNRIHHNAFIPVTRKTLDGVRVQTDRQTHKILCLLQT